MPLFRSIAALLTAALVIQIASAQPSSLDRSPRAGAAKLFLCFGTIQEGDDNPYTRSFTTPRIEIFTYVVTSLSKEELERQWDAFASPRIGHRGPGNGPECFDRGYTEQSQVFGETTRSPRGETIREFVEFNPVEEQPISAKRRTKSVFFRDPSLTDEKTGFPGATFDIEYQLLACMGELHLAYSLVENSVKQKKRGYWLDNQYWEVKADLPQVINLPLKGTVYIPPLHNDPIGTFGDDHAGKALGFGCFSGQSKKIANLKDHVGDNPTKEKVQAFIDKLAVSFETVEVLKSASAEEEIRAGLAKHKAEAPPTIEEAAAEAVESRRRDAEAAAAERRAAKEAEFQAAMRKYEAELAAQKAAVAQYEAAQEQLARDKDAQALRARAELEEYARKKAEHEAEMERHRKAQAEYEAQLSTSPQ